LRIVPEASWSPLWGLCQSLPDQLRAAALQTGERTAADGGAFIAGARPSAAAARAEGKKSCSLMCTFDISPPGTRRHTWQPHVRWEMC